LTDPGVDSWYHEKESAWLYRRVAAAEPDEHRRRLFEQLALAAEAQAARWEQAAARGAAGAAHRAFTPSMRARIVARLLERFEPASLRAVLAAMKLRGLSVYSALSGAIVGHAMPTSLAERAPHGADRRRRRNFQLPGRSGVRSRDLLRRRGRTPPGLEKAPQAPRLASNEG
jgi:hypothetical protein